LVKLLINSSPLVILKFSGDHNDAPFTGAAD